MTNWSTMKHRTRGPKAITGSADEAIELRPIHNAGPPITGTTIGPDLVCQVGPDGHELCDFVFPSDPEYLAEAERYAYRRQQRRGQL